MAPAHSQNSPAGRIGRSVSGISSMPRCSTRSGAYSSGTVSRAWAGPAWGACPAGSTGPSLIVGSFPSPGRLAGRPAVTGTAGRDRRHRRAGTHTGIQADDASYQFRREELNSRAVPPTRDRQPAGWPAAGGPWSYSEGPGPGAVAGGPGASPPPAVPAARKPTGPVGATAPALTAAPTTYGSSRPPRRQWLNSRLRKNTTMTVPATSGGKNRITLANSRATAKPNTPETSIVPYTAADAAGSWNVRQSRAPHSRRRAPQVPA